MKSRLAENIKTFRQERKMTQEQLTLKHTRPLAGWIICLEIEEGRGEYASHNNKRKCR